MKNQYFGDINDYRKYGLLRCLVEATGLRLGVCWLLTQDDGKPDGEFRNYLSRPGKWQHHDPELYNKLARLPQPQHQRKVSLAESWSLIPGASYYNELITDSCPARKAYFIGAWKKLADCPIIFLDPDNGIEVKSVKRGRKGSAKYLYWDEIEEAYRQRHSLVIYQHFPRKPREAYAAGLVREMIKRLGAPQVDAFATAHVLFLLIPYPDHLPRFNSASSQIELRWRGQIRPSSALMR